MLVQAAAAKWSVDPSSCRTENGEVLHDASAQKASYGDLVQAAAALTPPQDPPLKPATDFKLIGKSLKRLDTPDKVNGKAVYGIDALPPGVKIATLASCPVFGGKVAHVSDERAKTVPGVRQVIVFDDLVAVVGDHFWAAKRGRDELKVEWDPGPHAGVDSARLRESYREQARSPGAEAKSGKSSGATPAIAEFVCRNRRGQEVGTPCASDHVVKLSGGGTGVSPVLPGGDARRSTGKTGSTT